jgi:hypothetical protein
MRLAFLVLITVAATACSPFDPDLGAHPFRCGDHDPRCPDGYTCGPDDLCTRGGGGGDDVDASNPGFTCNDDSAVEPNETIQSAYPTPIPDAADCTSMIKLAVCPSNDKDLFRFRASANGKNLRVHLATDLSQGMLDMKILNSAGAVIGNATQLDADNLEVKINNLAADVYYVQVSAHTTGIENNYGLDILTCDVDGCPGTCSN